jgi:hypothetical protein
MTRVVDVNGAETILRRAGWKEWVIALLLGSPPVPATIQVGDVTLILKR